MYQIDSTNTSDRVGHSTLSVNMDASGNLYGGIYFLNRALQYFRINTRSNAFDW